MGTRYALDARVLASIVNSGDVERFSCYSLKLSGHNLDTTPSPLVDTSHVTAQYS